MKQGLINKVGKHKTTIANEGDALKVTYHSTVIVSITPEEIHLNTGGYFTQTTKRRMNQTAEQYSLDFHVYQKNHAWFATFKGTAFPFVAGRLVLSRRDSMFDMTPRYVPEQIMTKQGMQPVLGVASYPPNQHPKDSVIRPEYTAVEVKTPVGSRWFGFKHAGINAELRFVVSGFNSRNEVLRAWKVCKNFDPAR